MKIKIGKENVTDKKTKKKRGMEGGRKYKERERERKRERI